MKSGQNRRQCRHKGTATGGEAAETSRCAVDVWMAIVFDRPKDKALLEFGPLVAQIRNWLPHTMKAVKLRSFRAGDRFASSLTFQVTEVAATPADVVEVAAPKRDSKAQHVEVEFSAPASLP